MKITANVFRKALVAVLFWGAMAPIGAAPATPWDQWDWAAASADRPENDADGLWTGIFDEASPNDLSGVHRLEGKIGQKFASIMWFQDWSTGFATDKAENAWKGGYLPNVTWEPWFFGDQDKIRLNDIVGGKWDAYISQWGKDAAAFGKPVMVRWGHEFNGDWYPWSLAKNGESSRLYIQAYQRVHDLVTQAGARNLLWVWCPNAESLPSKAWNNPTLAYPGDAYVDWVAVDGYDFDGIDTFRSKFARIYAEMTKSFDKPLFIGEMSTGRKGADRAGWIDGMHETLAKEFPAIKGFVWFNINKERDWRLEESAASLEMAAQTFSLPLYHSRPDAVMALARIHGRDRSTYLEGANKLAAVDKLRITLKKLTRSVDGSLDWSQASSVVVKDKSGLEGTIKLGWDSQNIYLLAELKDATPLKNPHLNDTIWNGDNIEFCLSTDPAADPTRGFFTDTDWQFGFSTGDPSKSVAPRSWEWTKLKSQVPGAVVTAVPAPGGYRMEVAAPWASLKGFRPQAGMVIGFDLAIDNGGADGNRMGQWIWNGNSSFYNNPTQWGTLALTDD